MKTIVFLIVFVFSSKILSKEISLRTDIWCPYACDPGSGKPGFIVEIAQEIFAQNGIKVDYKLMNWARAITETREGKFEGIIGTSRTDAPDFVYPDLPQGKNINYFWVRKDSSWQYSGASALEGKRIGVINSYSYGTEVDVHIQKNNPAYVIISGDDALEKMIHMTYARRLDSFIENPNVLNYKLLSMPSLKGAFKSVSANITDDTDLFIAFSPRDPRAKEFAKMVSQGIVELRKNGRLKKILAKYGLDDWKK